MQSSIHRRFWRQASVFLALVFNALHRSGAAGFRPERGGRAGPGQRGLKRSSLLAGLLLALAFVLAAPVSAWAQGASMLFLSTDEASNSNASQRAIAIPELNNAWDAFQTEAISAGLAPVDGRGALSSTTTPLDFTGVKLVVVVTVYMPVDSGRMTELIHALETRPGLAIVIFSESCTTCTQNLDRFMAGVNAIQPASWPVIALGAPTSANYRALLNTYSLYASTFANAGLNPLVAGNYTPIVNVPLDYALYTQSALPSPPPPTVAASVVGLFIPQTASSHGQGACLFLTADASEFSDSHPAQYAPIALAFTNAALDPNGACAQPVAGAPDVWPTLSGLTSLVPGAAARVILTVANADQTGSAATTVSVALPSGLNLVSPPAGCTAAIAPANPGFICAVPGLPPDGSASFDFQIEAPSAITDATLSARVTPVPGEVNTGNNTAEMRVSAPGYPDLSSAITGPDWLTVGASGAYTVTVTNAGNLDSNDGIVTITLPADTQVDPASLPDHCTALTDTSLTCALAAIVQQQSATIRFTVTATRAFSDQPITVQVTGVSGEQAGRMANNDSQKNLSAAAGSMGGQPVPALATAALALLAALITGAAAARLRRRW